MDLSAQIIKFECLISREPLVRLGSSFDTKLKFQSFKFFEVQKFEKFENLFESQCFKSFKSLKISSLKVSMLEKLGFKV